MNNEHFLPKNNLHQQISMCSPMSPILGYAQNYIDNPSSQLVRSKSLNDISDSSLVQATDLSVDIQGPQHPNTYQLYQQQQQHQWQFNNNNMPDAQYPNLIAPYGTQKSIINTAGPSIHHTSNVTTGMPTNDNPGIYQQSSDLNNLRMITNTGNNGHALNNNMVQNQFTRQYASPFSQDPGENQCSSNVNNRHDISSVSNNSSPTHMFNVCNPIVMNLNGVTEQIGNLHL